MLPKSRLTGLFLFTIDIFLFKIKLHNCLPLALYLRVCPRKVGCGETVTMMQINAFIWHAHQIYQPQTIVDFFSSKLLSKLAIIQLKIIEFQDMSKKYSTLFLSSKVKRCSKNFLCLAKLEIKYYYLINGTKRAHHAG